MLTVAFIRHGMTDWNAQARMQGHTDVPLNAIGRRQAGALAEHLREECWDAVYASPLSRARETAEIIAQLLELRVAIDKRLLERRIGKIEGTTLSQRIAQWGENWRAKELNIESDEELCRRGTAFFSSLVEKYQDEDKRIIVVSHGGLIKYTLEKLMPQATIDPVGNTSLTRLHYINEGWECTLFNCMMHLDEALLTM